MTRPTSEAFYDQLSPIYDEAILRCVPRYREMLWALLRYVPHDLRPRRILELGSGSGNLTRLLLERFPDAEITGVDLSREMISRCRKHLPTERLTLLHRDFRDLGFEAASFDLAVSCISIHHIDDPAKRSLFHDLKRVLRPGGVVAYSDQFRGATEESYARHMERWKEESLAMGASIEEWETWMRHQEDHDHHAPLAEQMAWLREAGFADIDCPWRFLLWTVLTAQKG